MGRRKKTKTCELIDYEFFPIHMTHVSILFPCLCSTKQPFLAFPKPRYLEQLEFYLRKELQSLDLTKDNSQELKLQV